MHATENFLRLIWPDVGKKAIVGIKNHVIRHHWFSAEQYEDAATKCAELAHEGWDVYMALAGFGEYSREAEDAIAFKTLFLDIDCGEKKDYVDQSTARLALDDFVTATGLPLPLVLTSGYGLHVYWPLDTNVSKDDWQTLALSLKSLCKQHGLKTDQKVTADAARILRPIGSLNFKNGTPRRVEVITAGNICATNDLRTLLLQQATNIFEELAKRQQSQSSTKTDFTSYPEVEFNDILPRCATMRWAYEHQDEVREPLWYAALGLANYCKDKLETAYRLSSNHPEFDRASTEQKQLQWAGSVSGPPTCDTFRQCPGSRCGGCNERVSSPILLGRPNGIRMVGVVSTSSTNRFGHFRFTDGWIKVTDNGLIVKALQGKPDKDGNIPPPSWTKIADYGVQPLLNLRLTDPNGMPSNYVWMETHDENYLPIHNFVIPSASVNNSSLLAADFAKNGIINELETSPIAFRTFAKIMRTWVSKLSKEQESIITFRSFGWVGPDGSDKAKSSFLLGTKLYTPKGVRNTPLLPSLEAYQNDMHSSGSLDVWTKAMSGYNLPDMEPYMFATWTAWGAPLMAFTNSGNLVFNLVGDTGVGKSSMQRAIISAYGNYNSKMLLDQHDSTLNSVNGGMGYLNSLPYCREEASEKDAEEISTWVLTMTQGRDRGRLNQNLNMAHVRTWSTIAVTSSNISLREIVATTRKDNAARLARVWEQDVSLPISQELATQIFSPLRLNYGFAGPIYIQHLVENYDEVREAVLNLEAQLMQKLKAQGHDRFNVSLLAACFVGAQIASDLGLIDHDLIRGRAFAVQQYKRLRSSARSEVQSAEQVFARMLQDLQPNTLVVEYDDPGSATTIFDSNNNIIRAPAVNAVIKARYAAKSGVFYIALNAIREWYTENHVNFSHSMNEIQKAGVTANLDMKTCLTRSTKYADGKYMRCCKFELQSSTELTEQMEKR